jgi:DNA-binding NtrC family response regulator
MELASVKQRFGIIGQSQLLERALNTAVRVASTDLTVLITGESGVGKEVFSKIIHSLSSRKHNQFIAINCGAIPEGTINSELFGHEKGAFTGATNDRKGYFESYDGGTIFLDEIGEMPLDTQSFLLRILENGEFIRVGSNKVQKTDVRIIAATNVNLEEKIKKGKFREDLYYRLNTVSIKVPALRERPEDIYLLFRKFSADHAEKYRSPTVQLDEQAQALLRNYAWPGNVRELRNLASTVSAMAEDRLLNMERLIEIYPRILSRNLPAIVNEEQNSPGSIPEREILYKLLFDMKHDLNDLKSLVYELIRSNNLQVSGELGYHNIEAQRSSKPEPRLPLPVDRPILEPQTPVYQIEDDEDEDDDEDFDDSKPLILPQNDGKGNNNFTNVEILVDNLRLEDQEKTLIQRALRKFKGRRKEAAQELGISERTLYRKIKQYDM